MACLGVLRERWPSKGRIDPYLHCRLVACWIVSGLYRTVGGVFGRGLRELARGNFLARSRAVGGFAGAGGQVFWLGALGGTGWCRYIYWCHWVGELWWEVLCQYRYIYLAMSKVR